jgi:hypothetical protein
MYLAIRAYLSTSFKAVPKIARSVPELAQSAPVIASWVKVPKTFKVSIAHPKLLSKRFSSAFLVHLYLPEMRRKVLSSVKRQFADETPQEYFSDTGLEIGQEVIVKLFSLGLDFSEPVVKRLDGELNVINFIGKPKETCHPGIHQVILSVSDSKTNVQYESVSFNVNVKDYAFDHVSRPALSKITSIIVGSGSLVMFILTLLGEIDKTFGLTSGTVGGNAC